MVRIILVLLIFMVLFSPAAVLRCMEAQSDMHGIDPCVEDMPLHTSHSHLNSTILTTILHVNGDILLPLVALFVLPWRAILYAVRSLFLVPSAPPPRFSFI